ncbi:hypothetical protein TUM4438_15610 [Shewanella sairae]|uniref:DUF3149 domain-containing protein n=1 Tax=Shewanella sairae TaxID=190310 RepID=A0ABQ4PAC7_9GAMM|nr:hypothetical protein [Shewanella sairae]MCL1128237.1 hypothetical protein [Shewanella sairae]GIU44431.1 hypothetical protein TUM4438_15610 [Shewanella sairae]
MKTKLLSKASDYFIGAFMMSLGLVYNLVEQDIFGSVAFSISLLIFVVVALVKLRKTSL